MEGGNMGRGVSSKRSKDEKRVEKKRRQRLRKKRKLEALANIIHEDSISILDCPPGSRNDGLNHVPGENRHSSALPRQSYSSGAMHDATLMTHHEVSRIPKELEKKRPLSARKVIPADAAAAAEPVPTRCRAESAAGNFLGARAADDRDHEREGQRLSRALESARKKHRETCGKGRPLFGWDISALAEFAFGQLVEDDGADEADLEAVGAAVGAITVRAEEEHAGQVTIAQFEELVRCETSRFWVRRRARSLLHRALSEEQAGDLGAAETLCAACLLAWPGFAVGHLKMAQILRARGASEQRAIRDVEFHLKRALSVGVSEREEEDGDGGVAQVAGERLSLLLCQEGRDREAAELLKRRGFRYRLSSNILRYPLPGANPSAAGENTSVGTPVAGNARSDSKKRKGNKGEARIQTKRKTVETVSGDAGDFVSAVDSALPLTMLRHLQESFGSQSRFWSEHGYNSETGTPGYFSYIHSLDSPPETSIEQVIDRVKALAERDFPAVKEAKFVEWWAHRRPHSSGHQLHFDSDNEGRGGVRNPIVSAVVYVTGDVGGPTLVTTQRLSSKRLADCGWIVHPRVNRVCMFDGGVLHGVIPGRGVPPSTPQAGATVDGGGARVTWMVAFWRDIKARPRARTLAAAASATPSGAGAAQPFPGVSTPDRGRVAAKGSPTWPALFRKKPEGWGALGADEGESESSVTPVTIPRVWEDVDGAENTSVGVGVRRLKRLPEYDLCFQGF